jgi:integrase
VRLHGLRHAAGSLVARTTDAVFVRDFLGHAKLSTTNRYVSAKLRPEELDRLDRAFEHWVPVSDLPTSEPSPAEPAA